MRFIKASKKDTKGTISILTTEISLQTETTFNPKKDEWYILYLKKPRGRRKHVAIFQCNSTGTSLKTSMWPKEFEEPSSSKGDFIEYDLIDMYGPFSEEELLENL